MNLTDLKQVLDERSGDPAEHVIHHLRLQGVRAKVSARRRRRVASTTLAVVGLAGIAAAAVVPALHSDTTPTPAGGPSPTRTIEGFPEYANGARVVGARSAELPQRRVTLTIVPDTLDLVVFTRCDATGTKIDLQGQVSINGHDLVTGNCLAATTRPSAWAELGVAVGKPATFVMTITGASRLERTGQVAVPIPPIGEFGLAVGERVPFERYPLPPRPATLRSLNGALESVCTPQCAGAIIIRSDGADPNRPVRQTVTWKTIDSIDLAAQAPGLLHVRVNGVALMTGEWWDYELDRHAMYGDRGGAWKREFGLDLRPGNPVTIEVVPEHMTGAWQVVFSPAGPGQGQ